MLDEYDGDVARQGSNDVGHYPAFGGRKAGGGLVEDPWPMWMAALARGPVLKGTLAECMGLPVEFNGGGLYDPNRTTYSVFSFNAVSEAFTRKDDFWSDNYHDMGTADEFGDPYKQYVKTRVNGQLKQDTQLSEMLNSLENIVDYLSQGYEIRPGDVCAIGTPGSIPGTFEIHGLMLAV